MEPEGSVVLLTRAAPFGLVCSLQAVHLETAAGSSSIAYNTNTNGKMLRFWYSLLNTLYITRICWIKHVGLLGHIVKTTKKKLS